jgi:hypothetical protein
MCDTAHSTAAANRRVPLRETSDTAGGDRGKGGIEADSELHQAWFFGLPDLWPIWAGSRSPGNTAILAPIVLRCRAVKCRTPMVAESVWIANRVVSVERIGCSSWLSRQ